MLLLGRWGLVAHRCPSIQDFADEPVSVPTVYLPAARPVVYQEEASRARGLSVTSRGWGSKIQLTGAKLAMMLVDDVFFLFAYFI